MTLSKLNASILGLWCAHSASALSCAQILDLYAQALPQSRIELGADHLSALQKIRERSDLSPAQISEETYNVMLSAWGENLSPEARKRLHQGAQQLTHSQTNSDSMRGSYNYLSGTVEIDGPEKYRGTLVDFHLRMHDLRYLIGDHQLKELAPDHRAASKKLSAAEQATLSQARGSAAMESEWAYLHEIPLETRQQMIEELRSDPAVDQTWVNALEQSFLNASLALNEYLGHELATGRYNRINILATQRAAALEERANGTILGLLVASFSSYVLIANKCDLPPPPRTGSTLAKLCEQLRSPKRVTAPPSELAGQRPTSR